MIKNSLKKLRESNGLTQKEVAEKLNIDISTFSKIERGVRGLSIYMEKELADLYNVDIEVINSLSTKQTMLNETSINMFEEPEKIDI